MSRGLLAISPDLAFIKVNLLAIPWSFDAYGLGYLSHSSLFVVYTLGCIVSQSLVMIVLIALHMVMTMD